MISKLFLKKLFKICKAVLILIPVIIFIWLLEKNIVPFSKLEVKFDVKNGSPLISNFASKETDYITGIDSQGDYYRLITADPVYFNLNTPRVFQKATLALEFQNSDNQPVINIAVRQSTGDFYFKPLFHKILEYDLENWHKIKEGETILWQKEEKFKSIREFLDNLPKDKKIAEYFYDVTGKKEIIIPDYQPTNKTLEIDKALRGNITLYTYIKDEPLDFTFYKSDLNRYAGPDELKIKVLKENQEIYSAIIEDDGIIDVKLNSLGEMQKTQVYIPNLKEGVYKIILENRSDLIINKIQAKQHLLVFANRIWIAENESYSGYLKINPKKQATTLYTNGSFLNARTDHEEGLQTIKINNQSIDINEIHRDYHFTKEFKNMPGLNVIESPLNDLILETDGFFAFSVENYFRLKPDNILDLQADTNIGVFDYVIANYKKTEMLPNNWQLATQSFEAPVLYTDENKTVKFIINVPKLSEQDKEIKIKKINVLLEKPPITFKSIISKLKSIF